MGASFRSSTAKLGISSIRLYLNNIIERELDSRSSEDDMYRGDFGSSTLAVTRPKIYKGKSERKIEKNFMKFEDETNFKKYVIDYAIIGQLGYLAKKSIVKLQGRPVGKIILVNPLGSRMEFKNITELKNELKKDLFFAQKALYSRIFCGNVEIGVVDFEAHAYKSKPKRLPKKYQWLEEYVEIGYGGYVPE